MPNKVSIVRNGKKQGRGLKRNERTSKPRAQNALCRKAERTVSADMGSGRNLAVRTGVTDDAVWSSSPKGTLF
jgi:hypothetical protein